MLEDGWVRNTNCINFFRRWHRLYNIDLIMATEFLMCCVCNKTWPRIWYECSAIPV